MKHLATIQTGKQKKPHLVLVYAPDGVGKTTFAAGFPSPVFVGTEQGTSNLDVARFPSPVLWSDLEGQLKDLCVEKHDFKTLVIDSLDWLEILLHKKICEDYQVKTIELAAGGYGKGYVEALNTWIKFKDGLDYLRNKRGMNIVLIAHAEVVPFNDPTTQTTYDRYQLKLHKKAAAMFREYVDYLFFANFEVIAKKEGNKTRAFGDGLRLIFTERRPGFDAKSRSPMPFYMPLSYKAFEEALNDNRTPEDVRKEIAALMEDVTDEAFKKMVFETVEKAKDHVGNLQQILNAAKVKKENL